MDAYNDNDPGACAWLRELVARNLIPKGEVLEASILDLRPSDLAGFRRVHFFAGIGGWPYALRLAGIADDGQRRIWTGSPPCQPFSAAGKQLSRDDHRHLAPKFAGLVRDCRPDLLFGEQVASAEVFGTTAKRAGKGPASPPAWAWLDDLSDRLEAARYAVGASDIPAASIGAPHIRQRTYFGAIKLDGVADAECWATKRQRYAMGSAQNCHQGGEEERKRIWHDVGDGVSIDRTDPLDGFWRGADWLFCRDGKWRPVEPGLEPLADGLPARVVRLRGYGNAIVPQVAAIFIQSFIEATGYLT